MRVLYSETTAYEPVSPLFLQAFQQLADEQRLEYELVDEAMFLYNDSSLAGRVARRLLGSHPRGYQAFNRHFAERALSLHPDMVLVCKGSFISPSTLDSIKQRIHTVLVNYATD